MRNKIRYKINVILLLATLFMCSISCTHTLYEAEETVQVKFAATLPPDTRTRAYGEEFLVNTLVVGVFNADTHTEINRHYFRIWGTSTDVEISLAQEQNYSFVFWAYDNNTDIYNIDDLTAIQMKPMPQELTYSEVESMDAFCAAQENIKVTGNRTYTVELFRPLAQINAGTSGAVKPASLKAKSAADTYHPFTGTTSGSTDYIWNCITSAEATPEAFAVEDKTYNYLSMGYLFATEAVREIEMEMTVDNKSLHTFPLVKIQANHKSNIAGPFTGSL